MLPIPDTLVDDRVAARRAGAPVAGGAGAPAPRRSRRRPMRRPAGLLLARLGARLAGDPPPAPCPG